MEKFCFCFKIFGTHQNVFNLFRSFQTTQKRHDFDLKDSGTHKNVIISFPSFWTKQKRSTSFFGTHQNILVFFRKLASISERLYFRFGIVDITSYRIGILLEVHNAELSYFVPSFSDKKQQKTRHMFILFYFRLGIIL